MGFSIFCILEACLLIANALAILNERFLRQSKLLSPNYVSRFPRGQHQLDAWLTGWAALNKSETSDHSCSAHLPNLDEM
jgi:hypothetical protein